MDSLYMMVYLSNSSSKFSEEQLNEILTVSRRNNQRRNITGALVYCDGNILQILEGEKQELLDLYITIEADARHYGLIMLQNRNITERNFSDWSMGYRSVSEQEFGELEGYFDLRHHRTTANLNDSAVRHIFDDFIAQNSR